MLLTHRTISPKLYSQEATDTERNGLPSGIRAQLHLSPRLRSFFQKDQTFSTKVTNSISSSYDTAWLAMIPSKDSKDKPLFPECVEWIMKHQNPDGSWCVDPYHPLLLKESLSSTLACLLALDKWRLGQNLVERGLKFIEQNDWAIKDERQLTPLGFDVIFPALLEYAIESYLPLGSSLVDELLQEGENKIERYELGRSGVGLPYLAEGLRGKRKWKEVMKHEQRNGSLSNSLSATAAALFDNFDEKCYNFLASVLKSGNGSVPAVYPLTIYSELHTVDNLQQLGIDRFYREEIVRTLDTTYRCWLQRDEEILSNVDCSALAFRLLRFNGYDVSSDNLADFAEENLFFESVRIEYHNASSILELYKASQWAIYKDETVLEKIKAWTGSFLKQNLLNGSIQDKKLQDEVHHALNYTHDTLARLEIKRRIELLDIDNMQLRKTLYRSPYMNNRECLVLAIKDYNMCQKIYQQELEDLRRWEKDSKLDQLKFARQKLNYCYFSVAALDIPPELATVRISMIKNCVMATVVDDFFDCGGSREELENFMELFQRWEDNKSTEDYCSKQVEILFSALKDMVSDLGSEASQIQGRNVTPHLISIWHDLVKSMMNEAKWALENLTPAMEEYMENAYISLALGPIVLIPLYAVGPKLSEEMISSSEYDNLFRNMSLSGRLLNDLVSVKREREQGKLNSVCLCFLQVRDTKTEEEVIAETKQLIEDYRRELLRMVLQTRGSLIPRACKDLFLQMSHNLRYFYMEKDGYSCSVEKVKDEKAILWEPVINPYVLTAMNHDA